MKFNASNPFFEFLGRICDLLLMNLATVLCCLLVVPSGAAVCSLYSMTLKMVRDEEGETVKGYLSGLRDNFLTATPATLLLLVDLGMLAVIQYAWSADTLVLTPTVFFVLCIVAVLLTAVLSWLFPLMARYENRFAVHLKNACSLAFSFLPMTLCITFVQLLPFLILLLMPSILPYAACFWLLIGFAAGAYLNSLLLRRAFDRLEDTSRSSEKGDAA